MKSIEENRGKSENASEWWNQKFEYLVLENIGKVIHFEQKT